MLNEHNVNVPAGIQKNPINTTLINLPEDRVNKIYK
jgi:hypothetical protein